MVKRPDAPAGAVSMSTAGVVVWFDGHNLVINKTAGSGKGVYTYAVDQITGIQISRTGPLGLWVMRVLVAGEAAPRSLHPRMGKVVQDPFAVQFNDRHKAEVEAIAQAVRDAQAGLRAPVVTARPQPGAAGLAEQIGQLAALHQQGVLTEAEFAAAKARLLGPAGPQDQAPRAW